MMNFIQLDLKHYGIMSIKEFSSVTGQYNDYDDKVDTESNSTFIVNQNNSFRIFKDIYCNVEIYENN